MTLPEQKRSIGVFPNRQAAENALIQLQQSGFSMDKVSLLGPETNAEDALAAANNVNHVENQGDQAARAGTISGVR